MLVPIPVTDEQAKMGQEAAKTVGTFLNWLGEAGRALGNSQLATIAGDLMGFYLHGDTLHDKRLLRIGTLKAKRDVLLGNIDPARISEPSPSVVLPLLEAAMDESREQVQDQWARLLANAMIDGGFKVRTHFFTTLKALEPIDAAVLDLLDNPTVSGAPSPIEVYRNLRLCLVVKQIEAVSDDSLAVSLQNLQDCRCVHIYAHNTPLYRTSPYGRQFLAACRVE